MTSISPLFSMYTTQELHDKVREFRISDNKSTQSLADFIESELRKGETGLMERLYD